MSDPQPDPPVPSAAALAESTGQRRELRAAAIAERDAARDERRAQRARGPRVRDVVLTSPGGQHFSLTVDDDGNVAATPVVTPGEAERVKTAEAPVDVAEVPPVR